MSATKKEFRVSWKRADGDVRRKTFKTQRGADGWLIQLGPEPWKKWGKDPDDLLCCNGSMCGCGGVTVREQSDAIRKNLKPIEWIKTETREVGEWK